MSVTGGFDLYAGLGVRPTSPVEADVVGAADEEQHELDEEAEEVKDEERAPLTVIGGADALELAYHVARGDEPVVAWGKSSDETYPGDAQYASVLARCASKALHMVMAQMGARGGGGEEYSADTQSYAMIGKYYQANYTTTDATPNRQRQDLALQADAAMKKYEALRSILGSTDALRIKLQRMTLLAAAHDKYKARSESQCNAESPTSGSR